MKVNIKTEEKQNQQVILVLDFSGHHKELIARCVRDLHVFSKILPSTTTVGDIKEIKPIGIIFAGNPSEKTNKEISNLNIPILCVSSHKELEKAKIKNFLFNLCGAVGDYKLSNYIDEQVEAIRTAVGDKKVLLGLSGGVDSSVTAALIAKAIPNQLVCVFVDTGLMRKNEGDEVEEAFGNRNLNFIRVNAESYFLEKLAGVIDPEQKRKVIGEAFIRVFEAEANKLKDISFFAQGTIYPDIVESGIGKVATIRYISDLVKETHDGDTIKSHHNVGGLPKDMDFEGLVEPLSGLFKDEVRAIGVLLGLPDYLVRRQPFPGPGLGVRIIGEITKEKCDILREADFILREEIDKENKKPSQYFTVLTNTDSVGIKGDKRTYSRVIALRAVDTDDFMTCSYTQISHDILCRISSRITTEIESISRVVYDITSKPPATIEWE
ncbi:MAG: glutamine-hydrolyzing GMP synthase [Firmicutes bacterium]|nr:glutamine-hydrolyzing GMP synthase [Bacillota bacterium]